MKKLCMSLLLAISASSSVSFAQTAYPYRFSDFADLTQDEREDITIESLKGMSQGELDVIYARLDAGTMPDGHYEGTVVFDKSGENDIERVLALAVPANLVDFLRKAGETLWRGKSFNKEEGVLWNRMGLVPRYPANVFCGQSLLDSRKESIVLDYAYGDNIKGYEAPLDWPMARKGLNIRDEIRMVRPGLYLGRAYIQGIYALNFILEFKSTPSISTVFDTIIHGQKPLNPSWTNACH
jgi:hypothetical protein